MSADEKRAAKARYQRQWRASRGARTGAHGPEPSAPCGTVSAYKRHRRRGEPVDEACRDAWAEYHRSRYTPKSAMGAFEL